MDNLILLNVKYRFNTPDQCKLVKEALEQDNQGLADMICESSVLKIEFREVKITSIYSLCDEIMNQIEMIKKMWETL
ncbi:MAG: hypothetical protein M1162_05290 [Candidatus Thermoplasmatota archaeon]|nr:hypothetical protein [Candidatus Thermoplasmatota archaeon]